MTAIAMCNWYHKRMLERKRMARARKGDHTIAEHAALDEVRPWRRIAQGADHEVDAAIAQGFD